MSVLPKEVLIVGAGVAGLSCAKALHERRIPFRLYEKSDRVGGRIRTDLVDGFYLDRGFQVLLTAYPEASRSLNYEALSLRRFLPGALIRYKGKFRSVVDPWRSPRHALSTLFSPIGSLNDKRRLALLRKDCLRGTLSELLRREELSSLAYLKRRGFSSRMTDSFFRPFFGGVFCDKELNTSSRMLEFCFRMFASGDVAVPEFGMEEIPRQLAADLPPEQIRLSTSVRKVSGRELTLESGEVVPGRAVIVATDTTQVEHLYTFTSRTDTVGTTCFYYVADRSPLQHPRLVMNGEGHGPINSLAVMSDVNPRYAPAGKSLISISVLDGGRGSVGQDEVKSQLIEWFGQGAEAWTFLRQYRIERALPAQKTVPGSSQSYERLGSHLYFCGDYLVHGSIEGALLSGRRVADAVASTQTI